MKKGKKRRTVKSSSRQGTKLALSSKAMPPSAMMKGKSEGRFWKKRVRIFAICAVAGRSIKFQREWARQGTGEEKGIKKGGGRRDNYPVPHSSASRQNEKQTHRMCHKNRSGHMGVEQRWNTHCSVVTERERGGHSVANVKEIRCEGEGHPGGRQVDRR